MGESSGPFPVVNWSNWDVIVSVSSLCKMVLFLLSSLYTDVLSEYSRKRGRLSGPFPIVNC